MNYKEIWKKTEEDLKKNLPAHAYEAWIETLAPVGVTNQIFIVEAPNQFAYDWIINNYHDIILSSLRESDKKLRPSNNNKTEPTNPNSSEKRVNMKSVCFSGKKSK